MAIELKLSEEEVTQFYKGFLKLKGLYKFGILYEKYRHNIPYLLKLCSEAEREGISTGQLVKLAKLANKNNPVGLSQLEKQRQWYLSELSGMETERHEMAAQLHRMKVEKEKYENALFLLKSEISTLKDQLEDYRESCERERIELEKLKKEKESIEKSLRLGGIAE